jgi:hypothetical protein
MTRREGKMGKEDRKSSKINTKITCIEDDISYLVDGIPRYGLPLTLLSFQRPCTHPKHMDSD